MNIQYSCSINVANIELNSCRTHYKYVLAVPSIMVYAVYIDLCGAFFCAAWEAKF